MKKYVNRDCAWCWEVIGHDDPTDHDRCQTDPVMSCNACRRRITYWRDHECFVTGRTTPVDQVWESGWDYLLERAEKRRLEDELNPPTATCGECGERFYDEVKECLWCGTELHDEDLEWEEE